MTGIRWLFVAVLLMGLPSWAFADDAVFTFRIKLPSINEDGSALIDLKELQITFSTDAPAPWIPSAANTRGTALTIASNVVTLPAQVPWGGIVDSFQVTLPYPNGGSETGTMTIKSVDLADNVQSTGVTWDVVAAIAPQAGPPGNVQILGAFTP